MVLCACYVNNVASICHTCANERGIYEYTKSVRLYIAAVIKRRVNIKISKLELKARIDKILHINNNIWFYITIFGYKTSYKSPSAPLYFFPLNSPVVYLKATVTFLSTKCGEYSNKFCKYWERYATSRVLQVHTSDKEKHPS
jgi:hypothetical protein